MNINDENIASYFEQPSPPDIQRYIDINLDISEQVMQHLTNKGWTQKDLAQKLGKSEAEISKWLSGMHNLTLKSISKMEAVLGQNIIMTPIEAKKMFTTNNYIILRVFGSANADDCLFEKDDAILSEPSDSLIEELIA